MPTGSGKIPLFTFLMGIVKRVCDKLGLSKQHSPWLLDEASFKKMGELMANNNSKLLAMHNELSTFISPN